MQKNEARATLSYFSYMVLNFFPVRIKNYSLSHFEYMHSNSKIKRWTWNGCLHNVNVFPFRMTVITVIRQAFSVRSLTPDGSVRDTTPTATRSHSTVASLNTTDTKSQALCPDTDHMAHPTLETPTRHTTTLVTATLDIAHLTVDSLMLTDSHEPWTINKYSAVFFA